MATNGGAGFKKDGVEKVHYQHGDGWLKDGLGENVLHLIQLVDTGRMINCFDNIRVSETIHVDYDSILDLSYYVTGRDIYMVGGKYYTDYDYVLNLDKEVLEYRHHDRKFDVTFEYIRSNQLQEVISFIEAKELEFEFDQKASKLENEIFSAIANGHNNFYLGMNQWRSDVELKSEKIEDEEELSDFYGEYTGDDEENIGCVFIYHSSFDLIESFKKKIEDMIKRLEAQHKIEISVTTYYMDPW